MSNNKFSKARSIINSVAKDHRKDQVSTKPNELNHFFFIITQ